MPVILGSVRGPGLGQPPASLLERLGDYLDVREHGHEVRVAAPSWNNVKVDVVDDAGAGDAAEIGHRWRAILLHGAHRLGEDADRRGGEAVYRERFVVVELAEFAGVAAGGDHEMA